MMKNCKRKEFFLNNGQEKGEKLAKNRKRQN